MAVSSRPSPRPTGATARGDREAGANPGGGTPSSQPFPDPGWRGTAGGSLSTVPFPVGLCLGSGWELGRSCLEKDLQQRSPEAGQSHSPLRGLLAASCLLRFWGSSCPSEGSTCLRNPFPGLQSSGGGAAAAALHCTSKPGCSCPRPTLCPGVPRTGASPAPPWRKEGPAETPVVAAVLGMASPGNFSLSSSVSARLCRRSCSQSSVQEESLSLVPCPPPRPGLAKRVLESQPAAAAPTGRESVLGGRGGRCSPRAKQKLWKAPPCPSSRGSETRERRLAVATLSLGEHPHWAPGRRREPQQEPTCLPWHHVPKLPAAPSAWTAGVQDPMGGRKPVASLGAAPPSGCPPPRVAAGKGDPRPCEFRSQDSHVPSCLSKRRRSARLFQRFSLISGPSVPRERPFLPQYTRCLPRASDWSISAVDDPLPEWLLQRVVGCPTEQQLGANTSSQL